MSRLRGAAGTRDAAECLGSWSWSSVIQNDTMIIDDPSQPLIFLKASLPTTDIPFQGRFCAKAKDSPRFAMLKKRPVENAFGFS